jgi:hypothetical protein
VLLAGEVVAQLHETYALPGPAAPKR